MSTSPGACACIRQPVRRTALLISRLVVARQEFTTYLIRFLGEPFGCMRYWWVNQNQTHRQEIRGGYLWSPKRSKGQQRNPFYESMREVGPGDLIFSFFNTLLFGIGIATSVCYECPRPEEFGTAGMNWEQVGWKIRVNFVEMDNKVRPKDHMQVLNPVLPGK